ncbi:MAG: hypothetical protein RL685_2494 [Pseudomonadota bacterium]|jgi:hypothetical protein
MRRARALLLPVLLACGWAEPAAAWTQSGHMMIASFAYDALSEQRRAQLVALLRNHPRFEQDFLAHLPVSVSTPADQARWIFGWAAVWPDLARGQPAFERGSWHYVNLPLTLGARGLASCADARRNLPESQRRVAAERARRTVEKAAALPPGPPAPPAASAERLTPAGIDDIRAALRWAQQASSDDQRSPSERALALSWLLHLVGDVHQPLHAVALFSARRFELGDRGGNEILAGGAKSLHYVWDGLLGEDDSLGFVQAEAQRWQRSPELRVLAQSARRSLDLDVWLEESCAQARERVYSPAVLAAARSAESGPLESKPEAVLEPRYLAQARPAAQRRAVQAGARLAALLGRQRQGHADEPRRGE